jgi:hypothetical protein
MFLAWHGANPWFGPDHVKTGLAIGLGREAVAKGLSGEAYYKHVDDGMRKFLNPSAPTGKAEGGGPSGSSTTSGAKSYNALPPEARRECDEGAKRFAGPNKLFKTEAAWRENFLNLYNAE